jgi:hypothetical protein
VVEVGLTDCVPPVAARVYELLSLPVIVTVVAFVAATVKVDEEPAGMDVGLALIETVGAGIVTVTVVMAVTVEVTPTAVAV